MNARSRPVGQRGSVASGILLRSDRDLDNVGAWVEDIRLIANKTGTSNSQLTFNDKTEAIQPNVTSISTQHGSYNYQTPETDQTLGGHHAIYIGNKPLIG
jgi:hypothetical protein